MHNKIRYQIIKLLKNLGYNYTERLQPKNILRHFFYKQLFDKVKRMGGVIVECNVFYSQSLMVWSTLVDAKGKRGRVYRFDSLEEIPASCSKDINSRDAQKSNLYKYGMD